MESKSCISTSSCIEKNEVEPTPRCYKCKRNLVVIKSREKACKNCFIQFVEYTFKNTLREKCLFKYKTGNFLSTSKTVKESSNALNNNDEIQVNNKNEKEKERKEQNTAIALSGEICSMFLLYLFVKYLKNYKRQDSCVLRNEHAVFSTILFVDLYDDDHRISELIERVKKIFDLLESKQATNTISIDADKNNKIVHSSNNTIEQNKHDFINGVYECKVKEVNLVILKSNYFIKEEAKEQFKMYYDIIKNENDCPYLKYVNELLVYNNILRYCISKNINYVLWGNNANNLSNKTFRYTVLGAGINIPSATGYIEKVCTEITFIKPLKDLLDKEVYVYAFYNSLPYLKERSYPSSLFHSIHGMISNLDEHNNTTSIINSTVNNLLSICSIQPKKGICGNGNSEMITIKNENESFDELNRNEYFIRRKFFDNCTELLPNSDRNMLHDCTDNYYFNCNLCYICLGNKETEDEKTFIKKKTVYEKENLKKMKKTNMICSTCLSIFASNINFLHLYNSILSCI